jgi:hypothetical protein
MRWWVKTKSSSQVQMRSRPKVESLEERSVPSAAPTGTADNAVFIRYRDGQLWEHSAAGFQKIDINTLAVSTGVDGSHNPTAFILYDNGALYEWSAAGRFHYIDGNVVAVSASPQAADTVFILYNNHLLYEHTGTSNRSGFRLIDGNAAAVSAGVDDALNPAAFIVYNNNALYEWSPAAGFQFIDVNVAQISAVSVAYMNNGTFDQGMNTVFIVYQGGMLYQHDDAGFLRIDSNVAQVSAGLTQSGTSPADAVNLPAAYIRYTNDAVYQWTPGNPVHNAFSPIDTHAVAISANFGVSDTVFIIYDNSDLFAATLDPFQPSPGNQSFTYIDANVGP